MKKIIIGATSLAALGCTISLCVLNPSQEVENKKYSLQPCLNSEYYTLNNIVSNTVAQKEKNVYIY